jgi:ribosome-binding ATPase YchF (GTP1/OBG family)
MTSSERRINGALRKSPMIHLTFTRLPKIKAWIDQNNTGDPLIPFSVAFEERLSVLSAEEQAEEEKKVGAVSSLGKITQAGYSSLEVSSLNAMKTRRFNWELAYPLLHLRTG